MAHSEQRKQRLDYQNDYNEKHKEEIAAARKKRYHEDAKYREAVKARRRAQHHRDMLVKKQIAGMLANSPGLRRKRDRPCCPLCKRPLPLLLRPTPMLINGKPKGVDKKFVVMMFSIGELSLRIGKQRRTVIEWINDGILPEAQYTKVLAKVQHRRWTQDQVETIVATCVQFDLRPPISYEKIGFIARLKENLAALAPLGIDPQKYTVKDEDGNYGRPDADQGTVPTVDRKEAKNYAKSKNRARRRPYPSDKQ